MIPDSHVEASTISQHSIRLIDFHQGRDVSNDNRSQLDKSGCRLNLFTRRFARNTLDCIAFSNEANNFTVIDHVAIPRRSARMRIASIAASV